MDRSDTLAELEQFAPRIGVQRIADLSELDDLGVRVVAAIRTPLHAASISVCSGRGLTMETARTAALAEALERWCAEPRGRIETCRGGQPPGRVLDLRELVPAVPAAPGEELEWVRGFRIDDRTPVWVPAMVVFYPYLAAGSHLAPATHGLAAGATLDDAVSRGLLECIERDAYTRAIALATQGRDECPVISADSSLPGARGVLARMRDRGLQWLVRDITGGTGVPTALATIAEPLEDDTVWAHRGCAAAETLALAAERALTEAAQSRLVDIQGAREDLPAERNAPDAWFLDAATAPAPIAREPLGATGAELARRLVADGCGAAVAVDLSLPGAPLRVVRVVVPGLEVWADEPARVGPRLEAWCRAG